MGSWFQIVVDRDASLVEAKQLAFYIRDWLIEQRIIEHGMIDPLLGGNALRYPPGVNYEQIAPQSHSAHNIKGSWISGLEIIIYRTVFDSGPGNFEILCSRCKTQNDKNTNDWSNAISEWYEGKGQGLLHCSNCGHFESVIEWLFDPSWGFGNLGFRFWGWPPLEEIFIKKLTQRLGHRTVFVTGKY